MSVDIASLLDSAVLCYCEDQWAYFTTQDLDKQWGDDWNDAPWEHNAGTPYDWRPGGFDEFGCTCITPTREGEHPKARGYFCNRPGHKPTQPKKRWHIVQIAYEGPWEVPGENTLNSPWSVQDINRGATPWLRTPSWCKTASSIPAGTTLRDFIRIVKSHPDGQVWLPVADT